MEECASSAGSAAARRQEMLDRKKQQMLQSQRGSSADLIKAAGPAVRVVRPASGGSSVASENAKLESAKKLDSLGMSQEFDPRQPTSRPLPVASAAPPLMTAPQPARPRVLGFMDDIRATPLASPDARDPNSAPIAPWQEGGAAAGEPQAQYNEEEDGAAVAPASGTASTASGTAGTSSEGETQEDLPETSLTRFDFSDLRAFVMSPVPEGAQLQCTVTRITGSGLMSRFYPDFHISLSANDTFIMSAKKRSGNKGANYVLSLDRQATKEGIGYLGKVRSNFFGTGFVCYDGGVAPTANVKPQLVRSELGFIGYDKNIMGHNGPRRMLVALPALITKDGRLVHAEWKPLKEDEGADSLGLAAKRAAAGSEEPNLVLFSNKPPDWNENMHAHTLNFHGRVTKASVKNFQLVHWTNSEEKDKDATTGSDKDTKAPPTVTDGSDIILQFGRVLDDTFHLDVRYPMSLFQAAAICLTSLDHKLGCE